MGEVNIILSFSLDVVHLFKGKILMLFLLTSGNSSVILLTYGDAFWYGLLKFYHLIKSLFSSLQFTAPFPARGPPPPQPVPPPGIRGPAPNMPG